MDPTNEKETGKEMENDRGEGVGVEEREAPLEKEEGYKIEKVMTVEVKGEKDCAVDEREMVDRGEGEEVRNTVKGAESSMMDKGRIVSASREMRTGKRKKMGYEEGVSVDLQSGNEEEKNVGMSSESQMDEQKCLNFLLPIFGTEPFTFSSHERRQLGPLTLSLSHSLSSPLTDLLDSAIKDEFIAAFPNSITQKVDTPNQSHRKPKRRRHDQQYEEM